MLGEGTALIACPPLPWGAPGCPWLLFPCHLAVEGGGATTDCLFHVLEGSLLERDLRKHLGIVLSTAILMNESQRDTPVTFFVRLMFCTSKVSMRSMNFV